MRRVGWLAALCGLWVGTAGADPLPAAQRAALLATGVVSEATLDAIETEDRVRVIVSFHEPPAATRAARDAAPHRAALASRGDAILAGLSRQQFQLRRRFTSLPALSGFVDRAGLERLARDPNVRWVEPSLGGAGALNESIPLAQIGQAKSLGLSGQGVRIAVLDSGTDTGHSDLAGVVVEERCWCEDNLLQGCCPNGMTTQSGSGAAFDDEGHGTHIAGIIASNGTITAEGAAPDVEIVSIKVLDDTNRFYADDGILAALDWINTQSTLENPYVDIVNMSLATAPVFGVPCNPGVGVGPAASGWTTAVANLTQKGILVVVASGNDGLGSVAPAPACVQESFSVAASWDSNFPSPFDWSIPPCTDPLAAPDEWACISNAYDGLAKTDVVAPGAFIWSAAPGNSTSLKAGTSQAAAHVTGCAALVVEANAGDPTRTLTDLENDLRDSPTSITSHAASFGSSFPRLDCATAVPEPGRTAQGLALLAAFAAALRRASPSRHPGRCASS